MKTIQFDKVSNIYDNYVKVDSDIPFFLKETENYRDEILELMCGTGRVSIPLLEAGLSMTCVDNSKGMLEINFKPIPNSELRLMISGTGMEIIDVCGDYKYGCFDEKTSSLIIYRMVKV
jgi:ubiquinone/menaquinone biosynthesis C-methylase UbiE